MAENANPTTSLSISKLLNLSNLERVFSDMFDKLSILTDRMDKLEGDLSAHVSLSRFLSLQNEYESNTNLFENRLKYLEESVSEIKPVIAKCAYNQECIEKVRERMKSLVDNETFESHIHDSELSIQDKLEQISSNKCSNERFQKMEESQKIITQQISAMESMLQCKVDKSQVPLIQTCSQQLESLEKFRDQISQRVCIIDDQLSDVHTAVDTKLSRHRFEEYESEVEQLLLKKVNMTFLNEEVIKRLNALLPDLLLLLQEHKQVSTTACLKHIQSTQSDLSQCVQKCQTNKSTIDDVLKSLYNIPSAQQLNVKADKAYCDELSQQCQAFCARHNESLANQLATAHTEIDKLKVLTNALSEKTKVALRFVDWYSSLQLES